jgi:hypothetical protein
MPTCDVYSRRTDTGRSHSNLGRGAQILFQICTEFQNLDKADFQCTLLLLSSLGISASDILFI